MRQCLFTICENVTVQWCLISESQYQSNYKKGSDHGYGGIGAIMPKRDPLDIRIVDEVRNGYATYEGSTYKKDHSIPDKSKKSGIIDSQAEVGGWPE